MKNATRPLRTAWRSLLWKEWHEHKWKLLALTAILLAVPVITLVFEPERLFANTTAALMTCVPLFGLFLAMSVAAGENSKRTMPFLQSMPVPMWKPAAAKLGWAAVTVVVPILLVVGFLYGTSLYWDWVGVDYQRYIQRDTEIRPTEGANWFILATLLSTLGVLSLLVWGAAAGVNRRDEVRAGAIGILVVVSCWLFLTQLYHWTNARGGEPTEWWYLASFSAGPGGPVFALERALHWYMAIAAALSHSFLVAWYVCRFGKPSWTLSHSRKPVVDASQQATWLAPPRRSQLTAIMWKQARETTPLAILALAAIVAMSAWSVPKSGGIEWFHGNLLRIGGTIGVFVVIVAGIGVFLEDLKPGLHAFWRSRPVSVHQWFWVKFLTGLIIVAVAIGTPVAYGYWQVAKEFGDMRADQLGIEHMALVFLTLYCWSVATICLVRQPIYAGVFSIAALLSGFVVDALFGKVLRIQGWDEFMVLTILCIVFSIVGTLTAWLAVRFNLGYKG